MTPAVAAASTVALWSAWLVGLGAAVVLLLRAVGRRERRDLALWRPVAAGVLVIWLGDAPSTLGRPSSPDGLATVATAAGVALVLVGQVALVRQHVAVDAVRGWLDLVCAPLLVAGLLAVASPTALTAPTAPTAPGLPPTVGPPGAGFVALVPVGVAVTAAVVAVGSTAATGSGRERRGRLVAGALLVLAAAEVARPWLVTGGAVGPARVAGAAVVVHAAAAVALALASRLPSGATAAPRREGALAALRGPLLLLVPAAALLGLAPLVGPAGGLPRAALLCALAVVAVQVAGVVVRAASGGPSLARGHDLDELTGLGSRRALLAHLASTEQRSRPGAVAPSTLALVLVDLDRFKAVNDTMGHDAGDDLLRQVGARLRAASREGDLLTRQGGDEFAVVLLGATAAAAARRAREVVLAIEAPFVLGGAEVAVHASVGVAAWPEHAGDAEELLRAADAAIYRAKGLGGGVVVFDAAVDRARRDVEALVADLRAAVAGDALSVVHQPQVRADGTLDGVEALVRWEHPTRGLLGPEAFLDLAERHGLMPALTEQVLRRALAVAADLAAAVGRPVRVSVNASATSLGDDSLVDAVAAALAGGRAPAAALVVEITETQLAADPATARAVLDALVDLGVGISVDDYGTGYSSLAHLADLPASELKLDRSLVAGAGEDDRLAAIVSSTVALARDLGLRLVAEGVEDAATLERVLALGVDVTQGYLHSPPLGAADLLAWVARR